MELKDYRAAIASGWRVIVGTVLAALVVGAAAAFATPAPSPSSTSTRTVLFAPQGSGPAARNAFPDPSMATRSLSYAQLLSGSVMADRVAEQLGIDGVGTVLATVAPNSTVLVLTVQDPDPDRAKQVADAYVDLLPDEIKQVENPEGDRAQSTTHVALIGSDDLAASAAPTGTARILLLALLVGLGGGIGWALLRHASSGREAEAAETPPVG